MLVSPIGSPLSEQKLTVTALLWGREGVGKTTAAFRLLETGPGDLVVIDAEAGAKKKALEAHGVDASRVRTWPTSEQGGPSYITYDRIIAEVIDPMRADMAKNPDAYVGLVIDSFTEVARRILEGVRAEAYEKAIRLGKNRGRWFVDLADHGDAAAIMRSLLRACRDLPCHLFVTALERRDVDQNTGFVSYGPALGPAVATDTMGLVDLVGFCQVENIGGQDFRTATFTPTQTRRSKDRWGVLPNTLVDPFADRIIGYVDGKITKETDVERKRLLDAMVKPAPAAAETAPATATAPNPNKEKK